MVSSMMGILPTFTMAVKAMVKFKLPTNDLNMLFGPSLIY